MREQLRKSLKPGTRILLLAGLVSFLACQNPLVRHLEGQLYDLQLRLVRLWDDPVLHPDLVLVALDQLSLDAGLTEEHITIAAEQLPSANIQANAPENDLRPFLEPDSDGTLRGIRLYLKNSQGYRWVPGFREFTRFKGFELDDAVVTDSGIRFGEFTIPTDSGGKVYPLFHFLDREALSSGKKLGTSGMLAGLASRLGGLDVGISRLQPVPLAHLPEIFQSLRDKLTVLGQRTQVVSSVVQQTPMGNMLALQLHGSLLDSLLSGHGLLPAPLWADLALNLCFLLLLCLRLPGRDNGNAIGWWSIVLLAWFSAHQLLFFGGLFGQRAATLVTAVVLLFVHLIYRSQLLAQLIYGFGGQDLVSTESAEVEATICFTNLPTLITELESKDLARAQSARAAYASCIGHAVERHGGRLVDQQGDAQMLAFGLGDEPKHALRAIACSLEIVRSVSQLLEDYPSPGEGSVVHCGVVTGLVARGQVGGGSYKSVAAIGDTTNTAARLMGRAMKEGKAVLASRSTVEQIGPRIRSQPFGEISVKGKQTALEVEEVLSLSTPPPLVSRPRVQAPRFSLLMVLLALIVGTVTASLIDRALPLRVGLLDGLTPSDKAAAVGWAALDEETLAHHSWPWPRSMHAQVIKNCQNAGLKCLFYDVLFEGSTTPEEDAALLNAVEQSPSVVVAAKAETDNYGNPTFSKLMPGLQESGKWGLINIAKLTEEPEEVVRYALWQLGGYLEVSAEGQETGRKLDIEAPGAAQAICRIAKPSLLKSLAGDSNYLIRWGPRPKRFSYYRLLDPNDPIFEELKDSVVVVAEALRGPADTVRTPQGRIKGGLVHCYSVQTCLTEDFLVDESHGTWSWSVPLTIVFLAGTLWLSVKYSTLGHQVTLLLVCCGVGLAVTSVCSETFSVFLGGGHILAVPVALLLATVLRIANVSRALYTYVPKSVRERLENEGESSERTVRATILLTDIRGYTTLSEGRSPLEVLKLLNRYHELTAACYQSYGGHLLTYQGDAQIVVFGGIEPITNPVAKALAAAREIEQLVQQVAGEAELEEDVLRVGAGITKGPVSLGFIKAGEQLQYTVLGEPVRRAHKLQSLSDEVGSNIILDHNSFLEIRGILEFQVHESPGGGKFYTPRGSHRDPAVKLSD